MSRQGKRIALENLSGRATAQVPVALFTWEFDYLWKVAGVEPWRLACGGSDTWRMAHIALLERHAPDLLMYSGAGSGPAEPSLLSEDRERWVVRENNTGTVYGLTKDSYSLYELYTGAKGCDPLGEIRSAADADRLIPAFSGYGEAYLKGLGDLIEYAGERALVLPHHSPSYICACYAFGFEKAMTAMLETPELFMHACRRFDEGMDLRMEQLAQAGAEAVFIADGWASCDIISPAMFERFALPYQASVTEAAHRAGLKIVLWNEGNILPILSLQSTVDVDAFAFEQPRKGVDITVAAVREAFGNGRCLFGNLDSERLLVRNKPDEIWNGVESQLRQAGPRAPFVLNTGSPIPSDVEPAAVDAMIQSARAICRDVQAEGMAALDETNCKDDEEGNDHA